MKDKKPRDQVLGHADEADGIEEYDNALPDWWLGLLWFTIIFAFVYTLHYHVFADRSQEKELAAEMKAAELRWPRSADTGGLVITPELVAAGAAVYESNCKGCHGADLTGGIGPNLIDEVWIHGGLPDSVMHTINAGVPVKGMPTWGPILGPEKVKQVAAFVVSRAQVKPAASD